MGELAEQLAQRFGDQGRVCQRREVLAHPLGHGPAEVPRLGGLILVCLAQLHAAIRSLCCTEPVTRAGCGCSTTESRPGEVLMHPRRRRIKAAGEAMRIVGPLPRQGAASGRTTSWG